MTIPRRHPAGSAGILLLMTFLGACQGEPRSVDFFVANEAEAKRVQENCTAGSTLSPECENARTALATIAANRMLDYKPARATGRL